MVANTELIAQCMQLRLCFILSHTYPPPCTPSLFQSILSTVKAAGCIGITTADVVQIAGAVAVNLLGGPQCPLLMGRPDSGTTDSTAALPNPCDTSGTEVGRCELQALGDIVSYPFGPQTVSPTPMGIIGLTNSDPSPFTLHPPPSGLPPWASSTPSQQW